MPLPGVSGPFEGESHAKLRKYLKICQVALAANGRSDEEALAELAVFPAFQSRDAQALIGQLGEKFKTA